MSTPTDNPPLPEAVESPPLSDSPPVPLKPKRMKVNVRLKEQDVDIVGTDDVERPYIVREIGGKERDAFLNWVAERAPKYDGTGKLIKHKDFDDHQTGLIQRCLYDATTGKRVSEVVIRSWSASAQEFLYALCQEINSIPKETASQLDRDEVQKKD